MKTRMPIVAMCATFVVLAAACIYLVASQEPAEGERPTARIYAEVPDSTAGDSTTPADETAPVETFSFLENDFPGDGRIYGVMTKTGESAELDAFTAAAGKAPNLVGVNVDWTTSYEEWHTERLAKRGAMPMISWEPWDANKVSSVDQQRSEQPDYAVSEILSGRYDDYIDSWAADLAEWEHPVMLRFAHEMNGNWYPWADNRNTNPAGSYVEMWRYVHERFDAAGADNVIWVWSPNVAYQGSTPIDGLYPGDDYVDWVGLVGYFGHLSSGPSASPGFDGVFSSTLDELAAISDKPVFITETAAGAYGDLKAQWIKEMLEVVVTDDRVRGFVWFNVEKEENWRIDSSPEAQSAFQEAVGNPVFDQPSDQAGQQAETTAPTP